MGVSVGIDLGTTFSAVAIMNKTTNLPEIVLNKEGEKITPSVIQFKKDDRTGEVVVMAVGTEAKEAYERGEDGCVSAFKRLMGTDREYYRFEGKSYSSVDLSEILLKYLKESAEESLGEPIDEAVITVPAYFYTKEREATKEAAERAGLKVKKIIDEPNAAAMAFGLKHWRDNANILVYDLGGGTFDVTLIHMENNGTLRAVVTRGDQQLGGKDWDARLISLIKEKIYAETDVDVESDLDFDREITGIAEGIKKNLTHLSTANTKINVPGYGYYTVTITLDEFENNTADLLYKTGSLCEGVLKEAGIKWAEVTDILLVGGSTRMRQVPKYLEALSEGHKPLSQVNPDEAVALGAAIQASKANGGYVALSVREQNGKKVTDRSGMGLSLIAPVKEEKRLAHAGLLCLAETTAHAMGIIAINDEEKRYYNEVIIPANHPRPVRAAKRFRFHTSPYSDNQLEIYVLQGDHNNPAYCQIPYKYVVKGIRHVMQGEEIGTIMRIQYSYDENGIMNIQARQEQDDRDLPIEREDVPEDISAFGRPVNAGNADQGFHIGVQPVNGSRDVVHKYKPVTFSNVKWEKYDKMMVHPSGERFNEPREHVIANERKIEFHGYNVSAMNEGVKYTINATDSYEIECDIDTSKILPHPGGYLEIGLGVISAMLNEHGGNILIKNKNAANVGSRFHLKMSLTNGGHYQVSINNKVVGSLFEPAEGGIDIIFGFQHNSHCCEKLSHAYVSDISMQHCEGGAYDDSSDAETWDD